MHHMLETRQETGASPRKIARVGNIQIRNIQIRNGQIGNVQIGRITVETGRTWAVKAAGLVLGLRALTQQKFLDFACCRFW